VAQTAIGVLRQQLAPTTRVHGVCRHGGDAPYVTPQHVTAEYMVRAASLEDLETLERRVRDCFEAGALASGAKVDFEPLYPPYAEIHPAIGLDSFPAVPHMADFAAAGATPKADTAVTQGALSLALTAIDAATTPELRKRLLTGTTQG
jgi:metal-dependent amidase/aminoacylase/carboxypeptidase family protein